MRQTEVTWRWVIGLSFLLSTGMLTAQTPGGRLVVAQRAEPRTLNPLTALDESSRTLAGLLHGSLARLNVTTQRMEGQLAESWKVSDQGRRIEVVLRPDLRFSDGQILTADDVLFSVEALLDEKVAAVQRDLLVVDGKLGQVRRLTSRSVELRFAAPHALGERVLEGIVVLPKHRLGSALREGALASAWTVGTPLNELTGAGPFVLVEHATGTAMKLRRNTHYWRIDDQRRRLPYLDEVELRFHATEDGQTAKLLSGEADVTAGIGGGAFGLLDQQSKTRGLHVHDAGPGLDYTFLLFNLSPQPAGVTLPAREWFASRFFREAVHLAIDRAAISRLVYRNRATPLAGYVSPGRKQWVNQKLVAAPQSLPRARELLKKGGFRWNRAMQLEDSKGRPVRFSLIASASNAAYLQSATMIEADLKQVGIELRVTPLEFRSLVDRVTNRRDFETALMALRSGDVDPVADMNVLLSSGRTHLWNPGQASPATDWEAEIDRLFRQQMSAWPVSVRKTLYDRIQQILVEQLPWIPLVSPNVLVVSKQGLENLRPGPSGHPVLWNAEELYWRRGSGREQ